MIKNSQHIYKIDGKEFLSQEEYKKYLKSRNEYSQTYEKWNNALDEKLKMLSKNKSLEG